MITAGILVSRSAFLAAAVALSSQLPNIDTQIGANVPFVDTTGCKTNDLSRWTTLVRLRIGKELDQDQTLAGPLIRLAFHDATTLERGPNYVFDKSKTTTGGPNGSIRFEIQGRYENRALQRPLHVLENIMAEYKCQKDGVSFADIVALGGAVAVEHAGGPHIPIRMGRIDSKEADPQYLRVPFHKTTERSRVDRTMPSPALDSVGLRLYFGRLGLSEEEFIALSGAHGLGRHVSLLGMKKTCLKNLTRDCLEQAPVLLPFVAASVDRFSNDYFKVLLKWYSRDIQLGEAAFLPTDVALVL